MLSQHSAVILASEGATLTQILFLDTIPTLALTLATILAVVVAIRADNHMFNIVKQALALIPVVLNIKKKRKPETRGRHERVEEDEAPILKSRLARRLWWRHRPRPARQEIKDLENKLVGEVHDSLLK